MKKPLLPKKPYEFYLTFSVSNHVTVKQSYEEVPEAEDEALVKDDSTDEGALLPKKPWSII
jgi:hypothetical protein